MQLILIHRFLSAETAHYSNGSIASPRLVRPYYLWLRFPNLIFG